MVSQAIKFFCTVAVPKLDSVVGEEARLKLLLAKRNIVHVREM